MGSIDKAKGKKATLAKIMQYVKSLQEDIKEHRVVIGHCDSLGLATELEGLLKAEFGEDLNTLIVEVNPTAGSHCGPGTIGVSFYAKHR